MKIDKVNRVELYVHKKVGLKFETDLEKMFHKIISGMRIGKKVTVEIDGSKEEDRKLIIKAINKSCLYNNVEIRKEWSKKKDKITLLIDGV